MMNAYEQSYSTKVGLIWHGYTGMILGRSGNTRSEVELDIWPKCMYSLAAEISLVKDLFLSMLDESEPSGNPH